MKKANDQAKPLLSLRSISPALAGIAMLFHGSSCVLAQTNPALLARVEGAYCYNVAVSGVLVYVADGIGFGVYDVSNPSSPVRVSYTPRASEVAASSQVVVSGDYAYVATVWDGLRVYDVSDPANPINISHYKDTEFGVTNAPTLRVAVSGNYAYLGNSWDGLRILDISNPASPIELGHPDVLFSGGCVAISGHYAYVGGYCLNVIDISDPRNPIYVRGLSINQPNDLAVSGNFLYAASDGLGLCIVDISTPAQPQFITNIWFAGGELGPSIGCGVAVSGNFAYLANFCDGLRICDVSDPARPVNVGHVAEEISSTWGADVAVLGNRAYLANHDDLRIYSLSLSAPPPLNISTTVANALLLSWPTPTGAFAVQQNPDLAPTHWITVTNNPVVVGSQNEVTIPKLAGTMFYRLVSQ